MFVQPTSATCRSSRRGPRRGPGAALHSLTLSTALVLLALLSLLYAPAMAQPVLDKFEAGVVRQINPPETDPQYRDLWSQYQGTCSSTSTLNCLGTVSVTSTTAHDGTYAFQDHVTQGNAYVQFYTYSDAKAGWGWMHDFLASGPWQANTYTRLRFWVKVPQGITTAPVGEHNLEIGTFERALRYGDYAGAEDGGGHWYHFFNIPYTGEWHQVIVDTHPNHQRGGSGSTEWGDQLHVTGEAQWNYFDAMTRFYIDFYNNGYVLPRVPADFYFDGFELYQAPATENVDQIYSLNGVYVPASKTLSVGWMTRKNESVLYDVRYAFQDIAPLGWTAATPAPGGTGLPSPGDAYNGMEYQTTGINVSGHTSIFVALKPQNSSLWRQIELPLGGSPPPSSPPVAAFSATPPTGLAPLPVQFTDASTGSLSTWAWSFGDGTSSTAQNPPHTYSTAGTYPVSLTVSGAGGSATTTASITVTVPPPVAAFSATPTTGSAPLPVQFTDASTGSLSTWAWTFGDGTSSTAQNPPHTYSTAGTYPVSLTVSGAGGSATTTASISVTTTTAPPVAAFSAAPTTGPAPLPVQFTDASTGSLSTWAWSFGDGTSSTAQNPPHPYSTAGTYTASLTVTGAGGSATTTASITVATPLATAPVAAFSATPTTGPVSLPVQFTDASTGSLSTWAWTLGDGTSSTAQNPPHTYSKAGTYTVSLTVSGPGGAGTTTKVNYITVANNGTGLVAAYSFDEASGTTVTDVSGYGNHGTLTGATWTTAGKFGGALSFNGSSNWVTVNDAPSLDLTTGMTLEAWVYPTISPPNTWWTVLAKEQQPNGGVYYLFASSDQYKPFTGVFIGDEQNLYGGARLKAKTWTHLAATYDGTFERLYINGVQGASRVQTGLIQGSSGALRIGGNGVWGQFFRGRIDEVRLYNRALSASEIQADMQTPINVLSGLPPLP